MNRRLPNDATLTLLITSGAFYADIAHDYHVTPAAVRQHARRLGFEPIHPGERQGTRFCGQQANHPHSTVDAG